MTLSEFTVEFTRLHSLFGRREPTGEMITAWFEMFGRVKSSDFGDAVVVLAMDETEFPRPAVIWRYLRNKDKEPVELPSCEHCLEGRIYYQHEHGGYAYDHHAACDCGSGDVIAQRMISRWQRTGKDVGVPKAARYSWLFQRYGGIATARHGRGMQVGEPEGKQGKAKGSMGGMDRGLSRMAVGTYAKVHGTDYETAHQFLTKMATEQGFLPTPDFDHDAHEKSGGHRR